MAARYGWFDRPLWVAAPSLNSDHYYLTVHLPRVSDAVQRVAASQPG
jgi:hypothetical protein